MVDVTKPAQDEPWVVKTNPSDGRRPREVFAGLEKDARKFVQDHFPRAHVEPGQPPIADGLPHDVVLVAPNKDVHVYHGPEADWENTSENKDEPAEPDDAPPSEPPAE